MKKTLTTLFLALSVSFTFGQNVGINNSDPETVLDINGVTRIRPTYFVGVSNTVTIPDNVGYAVIEGVSDGCIVNANGGNRPRGSRLIIESSATGILEEFGKINFGMNEFILGDGGIWFAISEGSGWKQKGNAATSPPTDFIGTTDNNDVVFKRNNDEKMRIKEGGIEMANEILPNGLAGAFGQVLQSNGNGTMSWKSPGSAYGFKNSKIIYRNFDGTPEIFPLPLNAKDLMVEIWGAGAGGHSRVGGCSGAYGSTYLKTIDWGNQNIEFRLGKGGNGQFGATLPTNGEDSRVDFGAYGGSKFMIAQGALAAFSLLSNTGNTGIPGNYIFCTSSNLIANFITGNFGEATKSVFGQKSATIYTEQKNFGMGGSPVGIDIKNTSINTYHYYENGVLIYATLFPSASNFTAGMGGGSWRDNEGYPGGNGFAIVWWND